MTPFTSSTGHQVDSAALAGGRTPLCPHSFPSQRSGLSLIPVGEGAASPTCAGSLLGFGVVGAAWGSGVGRAFPPVTLRRGLLVTPHFPKRSTLRSLLPQLRVLSTRRLKCTDGPADSTEQQTPPFLRHPKSSSIPCCTRRSILV